jgi:hypothetical protein
MNEWIDRIIYAIARQEGWFSNDLTLIPKVRNNPMDLRYAGQPGAHRPYGLSAPAPGGAEPIAVFETPQKGILAASRQLRLWVAMGYSLKTVIHTLAPPNENNTTAYLANVVTWTGIADIETPLLNLIELIPLE